MDKLRKSRGTFRSAITRAITEAEAELAKSPPDPTELHVILDKLEMASARVSDLNIKVQDALVEADSTEEVCDEEQIEIEKYEDKVRRARLKIMSSLNPSVNSTAQQNRTGTSVVVPESRMDYKLPRVQMKKFNGEVKEWLGFWSQFQTVHNHPTLDAATKFQFLMQHILPGTQAREVVEQYTQTAENYPKVISALQERFGNKDLLMQVYIRELLKIVISTNVNREKIRVSQMYSKLKSHLESLSSLGVSAEVTAVCLYPMVESSLPEDLLIAWQRSSGYGGQGADANAPKNLLDRLMDFLKTEAENEARRSLAQAGFSETNKEDKSHVGSKENKQQATSSKKRGRSTGEFQEEDVPTVAKLHIGNKVKCIFCDKPHDSKDCFTVARMTLEEKRQIIQNKKCCFVCLRSGHHTKNCKYGKNCIVCDKRHSHIVCPELAVHRRQADQSASSTNSSKSPTRGENKNLSEVQTVTDCLTCSSEVVLATLMVTIEVAGREYNIRAMYDIGSQCNYISTRLANKLNLIPLGEKKLAHSLFGKVNTGVLNHREYQVKLKNKIGSPGFTYLDVLDKDGITEKIARFPRGTWMNELKGKGIWLTDVGGEPAEIDLLIGVDMTAELLTMKKHRLSNGLKALETTLGWIIVGKWNDNYLNRSGNLATTVTDMYVNTCSVDQLWKLDTLGICDPVETKSKDEKEKDAKDHFLQNVKRNDEGRYSVSLPWIEGVQEIPNNENIAKRRLLTTTTKLENAGKYTDYEQIFDGWVKEDIIEEVPATEVDNPCHYLPHRAVFKSDSLTTPIRPVFDASCKTQRSPSLNDCLEKGPNLMELIPAILLRFREKRIGVISDIRKAFQMIEVRKEDRDFLRFLWWKDSNKQDYKIYRHKRVVFGVNCSPFLLAAVIELHLRAVDGSDKLIAEKLLESLYVDNCVASVNSYEEYEEFKDRSTTIMAEAKMDLRLWNCSSKEVTGIGPLMSRGCGLVASSSECKETITSVLGLKWDLTEDTLFCDMDFSGLPDKLTKRTILSYIQKIYDPMGIVCPALLLPKKILQEAWVLKSGWDDSLSEEMKTRFLKWCEDLHFLSQVKVPRDETGGSSSRESWQIDVFCDASQDAYAAAVFLRTKEGENIEVQLLQAKSRVAPLNKTTIPRMELLSCTIAARLADSVKKALSLGDTPHYYWSDSTTALAWIKRNDNWGTFVGNRVREILKFTRADQWGHVPGINNPADLPSRGCSPSQLLISRWWEGPDWLKKSRVEWPVEDPKINEDEVISERKKVVATLLTTTTTDPWYLRSSSYYANIRTVAWWHRFINYVRKRKVQIGFLSIEELKFAEITLLRIVQQDSFPKSEDIISGIRVERQDDGLIHVKTKLLYREDKMTFRYPILLPKVHPLVQMIIESAHKMYGHAGVQFLMGKLREKYWIIQGRRAIRSVVKKCTVCRRFSLKKSDVIPAALPNDRVKTAKTFESVGVDLAGPLVLKNREKVWILMITCAVYRCVHLELVDSISTDAFLEAFTHFTHLRGRPSVVFSDNGTNFVGANNAFKEINWDKVTKASGLERIKWRFNPPSAAWWGGWWERLIRTMKDLLKKIMGNAKLSRRKLGYYLSSVAAIMNERPLTTVSEDPTDLIPLTPSMFMNELPIYTSSDLENLKSRDYQDLYKQRKTILDEFKMRFRREYLSQLVQRQKGQKILETRVGDIVLIGDDNKKRWQWPLGKIVELIHGRDGNVRVVRVKTASGPFLRPIQRIYPLEVSSAADLPRIPASNKEKEDLLDNLAVSNDKKIPEVKTRCGRQVKTPDRYGQ